MNRTSELGPFYDINCFSYSYSPAYEPTSDRKDQNNFDSFGYDQNGKDVNGYDVNGYNDGGYDPCGHDKNGRYSSEWDFQNLHEKGLYYVPGCVPQPAPQPLAGPQPSETQPVQYIPSPAKAPKPTHSPTKHHKPIYYGSVQAPANSSSVGGSIELQGEGANNNAGSAGESSLSTMDRIRQNWLLTILLPCVVVVAVVAAIVATVFIVRKRKADALLKQHTELKDERD